MAADKESADAMSDNTALGNGMAPCKSELLCFLQHKAKIIAFDHLVKLCTDFYNREEILAARTVIDGLVSKRLTKRQGAEAQKCTVEDILKAILDPHNKMPTFYAVELGRLPPVSTDHCDVSMILNELQALRSEVRHLAHLREEVDNLKEELHVLRNSQAQKSLDEWPRLPCNGIDGLAVVDCPATVVNNSDLAAAAQPYAAHARRLKGTGIATQATRSRKPPIIGKSSKFDKGMSVATRRSVDVFVSRWNPHTTESEISECVGVILDGKYAQDTKCKRLKAKYEHLYAPFFVSVSVPSDCMREVIDLLMNGESWPAGILVKRYFRKKNGDE